MFKLPALPYAANALEPALTEQAVTRHYLDNHAGYIKKLNDIVRQNPQYQGQSQLELALNTPIGTPVNNNAAQAWAHQFWWESMCPASLSHVPEQIAWATFRQDWVEKGKTLFGSGWLWLVQSGNELQLIALPNAVLPQRYGANPLLVMDLWEHAYYCDYGTNRASYLERSLSILNWNRISQRWK